VGHLEKESRGEREEDTERETFALLEEDPVNVTQTVGDTESVPLGDPLSVGDGWGEPDLLGEELWLVDKEDVNDAEGEPRIDGDGELEAQPDGVLEVEPEWESLEEALREGLCALDNEPREEGVRLRVIEEDADTEGDLSTVRDFDVHHVMDESVDAVMHGDDAGEVVDERDEEEFGDKVCGPVCEMDVLRDWVWDTVKVTDTEGHIEGPVEPEKVGEAVGVVEEVGVWVSDTVEEGEWLVRAVAKEEDVNVPEAVLHEDGDAVLVMVGVSVEDTLTERVYVYVGLRVAEEEVV